jgi:carbamoyltransferase
LIVLGLNAFHADSAACLLVDGRLVAAVEEERLRRVKHWAGFPSSAIGACLAEAGITPSDLDVVAVNTDPAANRWRRLAHVLRHPPPLATLLARLRQRARRLSVAEHFQSAFEGQALRARIVPVEHHRAHLASAFYCSGHRRALALSVDGMGDFASTAWAIGDGRDLRLRARVLYPHSLGIFYQAMTQYLGFRAYGDEYKVMGLAAYGRPRYRALMQALLRLHDDGTFSLDLAAFRHHRTPMTQDWSDGVPRFAMLYSERMPHRLGLAPRHDGPIEQAHLDLAHSAQERYEDALVHLVRQARLRGAPARLALAGGCAMNSVANGRLYGRCDLDAVYVQPAAGDAGGALGAALCAHVDAGGALRELPLRHAALGPHLRPEDVAAVVAARRETLLAQGCEVLELDDAATLCDRVAAALAHGSVVGWFQGRMEWGPRALGQRSILADPRRHDIRDLLNAKIKRRESFRPFAPSVLREAADEWFEAADEAPFMMKVFRVRSARRGLIPAVTHVDGTARLQTVDAQHSPLYHRLIRRFHALTGVPMLLNTSFNENEPIVSSPEQAIDCFLRTRMDMLVLHRTVIRRQA